MTPSLSHTETANARMDADLQSIVAALAERTDTELQALILTANDFGGSRPTAAIGSTSCKRPFERGIVAQRQFSARLRRRCNSEDSIVSGVPMRAPHYVGY